MSEEPVPMTEEKKLNKKALFLIIAVPACVLCVFLILAFASYNTRQSATPSIIPNKTPTAQGNIQPLPQIYTVIITDHGFSPAQISIQKGTAVKWVNNSSTDNASINSDDYPTNQRYPELNLGKVSKGSSVAHIFTTSGAYMYHNQFNPKQTGTVTVK